MRDRSQQRRLHEVAAPQRLGLERLLLQTAAVERDGEQRCERRKESVAHPEIGVGVGRYVERADGSAVDLKAGSGHPPHGADAYRARSRRAGCRARPPPASPPSPARCPVAARRANVRRSRRAGTTPVRAARRPPPCRRDLLASSLTTSAVTEYTARANQFAESRSVNVCVGGRKKKLNASMLATATGNDQ